MLPARKVRKTEKLHRQIESLESRLLLSVSGSPSQLSPSMIEQAYNLKSIVFNTGDQTVSATGAGQTIAVIDAFGDPGIETDLRTFDSNFGISDNNDSGQFVLTIATPQGPVTTDGGWAAEEALDVEWAHAIAPQANILLVEAQSSSVTNLTNAVDWARSQSGVVAVSMSWGNLNNQPGYDSTFTTPAGHTGVTFVAGSGDTGQLSFPATSPNVLAVGGTTLTVDSAGNFSSESAWSGSGGGTSPDGGVQKPDVAYDGNPSTGFLVYDSVPDNGSSGWIVIGGTSAGSPQWAAMIALADQGRSLLGLGSLDGPTEAVPQIDALPAGDFNEVTGNGATGLGSPIGEKIISALVGGNITSVSSNPSPSAAKLAFSQQPASVVAGKKISPSVSVSVEDSDGSVVASDNSSVTISIASGPGSIDGTLTVTAVNGVAKFPNLLLDTAGSYTLSATDAGLATATSNSFAVNPAAASQLIFVQQPSDVIAGQTMAIPVAVQLEDTFGNPVTTSGTSITLTSASGPGNVSSTVKTSNGIATFSNLTIQTAGSYVLQASSHSFSAIINSTAFDVTAAAAAKLEFEQQPSSVAAGSPITPAVIVNVEDAFGNSVTTDSSTVTLALGEGPGAVGGIDSAAAVNGIATFSDVTITRAGAHTLTATDAALTSAVSSSFNVTAPPPAQVAFSQLPANTTVGVLIAPFTVSVEDQNANVVLGNTSTVTLSVKSGPSTAVSGTLSAQAVDGIATFSNISFSVPGSYILQATDGALAAGISTAFVVTPTLAAAGSAATHLIFLQQVSTLTAGIATPSAFVVDVLDASNSLVSDDKSRIKLSIASAPPHANVRGAASVPATAGVASFDNVMFNVAGTYTLTATDGRLGSSTSASFVVQPGAPVKLIYLQQPSNSSAGVAIAPPIAVELLDKFKNVVTNDTSTMTLAILSGPIGANIGGADSVATISGIATFDNVVLNTAGHYRLAATDDALTLASKPVTISPGAAAIVNFTQEPQNVGVKQQFPLRLKVSVTDAFGNAATNGAVVTLAVNGGPAGGEITGKSIAIAHKGVALFPSITFLTPGDYTLIAVAGSVSAVSTPFTVSSIAG